MASIIGEFKHADGLAPAPAPAPTQSKAIAFTDKLFGWLGQSAEIYNKIRTPQPSDPDYEIQMAEIKRQQTGVLGMKKPWGAIVIIAGVGLAGWGIYKLIKK